MYTSIDFFTYVSYQNLPAPAPASPQAYQYHEYALQPAQGPGPRCPGPQELLHSPVSRLSISQFPPVELALL